ncbi:CPLA2 [Mytilus edulis]|uniref:PLA2G4 n=1 Tax=Mytilus edulis TaxID=6550 RepID=A0A8S3QUI8_MYTED|nr:CPLA2 [Mytilus edulis]
MSKPDIMFFLSWGEIFSTNGRVSAEYPLDVLILLASWFALPAAPAAGKTKDSFHAPGMMLIDAGLACNSPYPLVLHPSRQVDIIISFDFSNRDDDDNWPFKHLVKAERWAKEKNVCFPEIENKLKALNIREEHQRSDYEEVYVFEGPNSPTIVHFVLINKSFKKDYPARNFRIFPDYGTFRFYYAKEEFDRLKLLVRHNIIENRQKIIDCLNKKIQQKQSDKHRK